MIHSKKRVEQDVLTLSLERIRRIYDLFDHVSISFSGGKDSTVCLNLALQIARERKRLPLDVRFFDEEAIHPETIEYVERVSKMKDVKLSWFCLPVKHRNACSRKQPYWYTWDPREKDKWCRPLPKQAITKLPNGAEYLPLPEITEYTYNPKETGTVGCILGIRADESIRRYQSVARKERDNYISQSPSMKFISQCKPIYDWGTQDVWTAPFKFGWDYNRTYDIFDKVGISPFLQRVCPPFGEEPFQSLYMYAICWPDLWEKMLQRVKGAATAGKYSRSPLYFRGGGINGWNPEQDPREQIKRELQKWPVNQRREISERIEHLIERFEKNHPGKKIPIDGSVGGNRNDFCWKYLYMVAEMGDLKGRRVPYFRETEEYEDANTETTY